MKKPLLIFFVLLFLGAMFIIGKNPKYHTLDKEQNTTTKVTTGDVIKDEIIKEDKHIGEE